MKLTVHAFGAGVQSVALLQLYLDGKYPRPDIVMFADTGAEPIGVYKTVMRAKDVMADAGVPFEIVRYHDHTLDRIVSLQTEYEERGYNSVPLYIGKKGMMKRECTHRYKIMPIRRRMRELGATIGDIWLGISTDEITRVKPSMMKWLTNIYPLIELDLRRSDCERVNRDAGWQVTKSSCVFCPYRSRAGWEAVKAVPEDWERAVAYDRAIRNVSPDHGEAFVHASRKPLEDAVGEPAPEFDFQQECEGYCGL